MNGEAASSAVAFMASMESKMRLLMSVGDVVNHDRKRTISTDASKQFEEAKKLIGQNYTVKEIAKISGMNIYTLRSRLRSEGIKVERAYDRKWSDEVLAEIEAHRKSGMNWHQLSIKYKADPATVRRRLEAYQAQA